MLILVDRIGNVHVRSVTKYYSSVSVAFFFFSKLEPFGIDCIVGVGRFSPVIILKNHRNAKSTRIGMTQVVTIKTATFSIIWFSAFSNSSIFSGTA